MKLSIKFFTFLLFLPLTLLTACHSARESTIPVEVFTSTSTIQTLADLTTETPKPVPIEDPFLDVPKHPTQNAKPTISSSSQDKSLDNLNFPDWVSDPEINVLLFGVGPYNDETEKLVLVNASTFEIFELPQIDFIYKYFWTPEGKEIGILNKDLQLFLLNTTNNQAIVLPTEEITKWHDIAGLPSAYVAYHSLVNPKYYNLFPERNRNSGDISCDGSYVFDFDWELDVINIVNFETDEVKTLVKNTDVQYPYLDIQWSPLELFLAEVTANKDFIWGAFDEIPEFTMRIYNVQGQVTATYKNITSPNWSPDGTKFLYPPLNKQFLSFWHSPPCIYDRLTDQTKCFNDLLNKNTSMDETPYFTDITWLPGQTSFAYIYFKYDHEIDLWDRGICFVDIDSGRERCILEELQKPGLGIVDFQLSPDAQAVYFFTNDTGPISDDMGSVQMGIADVSTGNFIILTEVGETSFHPSSALWRP